ncbi:hypothetical protein QZH41_003343 [Actinostola sp. cb2023]|nr:hypothetical protein QZH41_003343 [Actinostola sp. cb2023]
METSASLGVLAKDQIAQTTVNATVQRTIVNAKVAGEVTGARLLIVLAIQTALIEDGEEVCARRKDVRGGLRTALDTELVIVQQENVIAMEDGVGGDAKSRTAPERLTVMVMEHNSESYEKCICRSGFWGESCKNTCPGGRRAPCHHHGVCNTTTGLCQCDLNWQGDDSCSSCTPGWLGRECSIIQQQPNDRTAGVFGPSNLVTLDGAGYRFLGNGEYHLLTYNDISFEVQGRMVTCFDSSSCVNSVAVKVGNNVVMIHGRFSNNGEPSVFIDGKQVHSLEANVGPSSEGFVLRRASLLRFTLESNHGVRLDIRLYDRYLDVHMQAKNKTYCESAGGLWGNCNGQPFDDFKTRSQAQSMRLSNPDNIPGQAYIHEVFGPSWKVPAADSLFTYDFNDYHEQRDLGGGGYALFFNNTGVQTSEIYSITSSDISIEFMIKLMGTSGFGAGHYTTFDGAGFNFGIAGEYYALNTPDFAVQVRQIPCGNYSFCITSVAVKTEGKNITIRAAFNSHESPLVWINRVLTRATSAQLNQEYIFLKTTPRTYEITNNETSARLTLVRITTWKNYLSFEIVTTSKICWGGTGLCSSCDGNVANDFTDSNATSHWGRNATQKRIIHLLSSRWYVKASDSMFVYDSTVYHEKREITAVGYCLAFNGSIANSMSTSFSTSTDLTLQFFVRISERGGTILSYATSMTFAIVNDATVKIYIGAIVYDTGEVLQMNTWYQISLVYQRASGVLTYHHMNSTGVLGTRKFFIGYNHLLPGGKLWLGQWFVTKVHITGVAVLPFVGLIDNLRLWNAQLNAVEVRQSFYMVLKTKIGGLSSVWLFDDGEGRKVRSATTPGDYLTLPELAGRRPLWRFSYAVRIAPTVDVGVSVSFANKTLETYAIKICKKLVYDSVITTYCGSYLHRSQIQFYYLSCLKNIKASRTVNAAYISVSMYAEYCYNKLGVQIPLLRHLCHVIPYSSKWIGPSCDIPCVFGKAKPNNNSICVCDSGYWGRDCTRECPGGSLNPCSGHGKCDAMEGTCACDLNWQGKSDCSNCTNGWVGQDCSIAVSHKKLPSCSIFSGGHFSSFDGAHFGFYGVGEFWLINNVQFKAQMRQISCSNSKSRCINAVAFSFRNDWKMILHAAYTKTGEATIWLNDRIVKFTQKRIAFTQDTYLEYSSSTTYTLLSKLSKMDIKIRVIGTRISITGRVGDSLCQSAKAACGNCDGDLQNDLTLIPGETLEQNWKVEPDVSLFSSIYKYGSYEEAAQPTGAEYGLRFKGVGIETDILPDIFRGSHVTVELLFKTDSKNAGVLYCYSYFTALAVYMENTIKVRQGSSVWDTQITPDLGKWNQITLVYYQPTGLLTLYFINAFGSITHLTSTVRSRLYVSQGSISIGQWVPGYIDWDVVSLAGFVGYVDEVRVWNRDFSLSDVRSSWTANVQRRAPYLAILWKFNEGEGKLVRDVQSGIHLYIADVDNAPVWVYSTAPVVVLQVSHVSISSGRALQIKSQVWCNTYIVKSSLGRTCNGLGQGSTDFYYRSCLQIIGSYDSIDVGVEVVVAFADACEVSLNLTLWPARQMCNTGIFKNSRLTDWIGSRCDHPCIYGYRSFGSVLKCQCDRAIWGNKCDGFCPGGPFNQCYGHGTCLSLTGTCTCTFRWRGKEDCSRCTRGYYGLDCSISVGPRAPGTSVSTISGSGHYLTLAGVKMDVSVAGEFHAFVSRRLGISVQIRQLRQGSYSAARCVFVRGGSTSIAIHTSYGATSSVIVAVNGVQVNHKSFIRLGSSGFTFHRDSHGSYVIVGPENFRMVIYHRGTHLDITMVMDRSACFDSCGLLGQCGGVVQGSNCTAIGIASSYNISLITQLKVNAFVKKWSVPANDSGFTDILEIIKEKQILTSAGSCLYFNGSGIVSPPLVNVFIGNFVSIQFYVKAKDPIGQGGTIISFASNSTFAITVKNGTLWIHYGSQTFNTLLVLETLRWNQISLVYRRDSGFLQFYRITSTGIVRRTKVYIGLGAFAPSCSVGIALWTVTDVVVNIPGFVGWLDELRIWNKRLDGVTIQQLWRVNVKVAATGLGLWWNFNEGQGYIVTASVGSVNIALPSPPWAGPIWMPSDLNISLTSTIGAFFPNKSLEEAAKRLCQDIFLKGPFNEKCANATGSADFYYEACIMDVAATGSLDMAKESTVQMASECQAARNLSTLPGQSLCNVYPSGRYDDWVGANCTIKCIYGQYSSKKCKCDYGYWGRNCSEECPGGAVNPCSGRGQCDVKTGECKCYPNWRGDELCSTCTPGWIGATCEIAVSPQVNITTTKVCQILENGKVIGFDSSLYSFSNVGQWELSPGDTEQRTKVAFIGVFDELRIWHRAFDPILIQQNAGMNVQPADPGLGGLWKFNEGEDSSNFALLYDKTIRFVWNGSETKTNLSIAEGVWTHIALTWRSNDGRVNIITSSSGAVSSEDKFGIHVGQTVIPGGFLVLGRYMNEGSIVEGYILRGALDELRVWQYAKNNQDVLALRNKKFDHYHDGLLINLPIDEGYGSVAQAWMYNPVNISIASSNPKPRDDLGWKITFTGHPEDVAPVWLASGVTLNPLTNYSVSFRNASIREEAIKICHKWFYTGNVQGHCSSALVPQARFYYEACIADVADTVLLIFLCRRRKHKKDLDSKQHDEHEGLRMYTMSGQRSDFYEMKTDPDEIAVEPTQASSAAASGRGKLPTKSRKISFSRKNSKNEKDTSAKVLMYGHDSDSESPSESDRGASSTRATGRGKVSPKKSKIISRKTSKIENDQDPAKIGLSYKQSER